jgi:hypothetical protein
MSNQAPTLHASHKTKNKKTTRINTGENPKATKNQPITNFFKTNSTHFQTYHFPSQSGEEQESSTTSLQYSTSDSSTNANSNIPIRPAITIRQNKDVDSRPVRLGETSRHHGQDAGRRYSQIKIITNSSSNLPFGDDIHEPWDGQTILFHNINGLKDKTNWFQILLTMKELQVDIFGFAETNQQMNRGGKYKWTDLIRRHYYYSRTVHSESKVITDMNYKPGGTISTITGKWQARVTELGQDSRGLGRWTFIKISSKKRSIIIITAYRPCVSQGPSTTWIQQWSLLREEGEVNPDPIKCFYRDIEQQLMQWKENGYEIILMIDANESIGNQPGVFNFTPVTFESHLLT